MIEIAPPKPKIEFIVAPETEPPYRVLLHNDDLTPMDFVTDALQLYFDMAVDKAQHVMLTAHYSGVAYVGTYPRDDAQRRVDAAHQHAREAGYPLNFTLEPEE